MNVFSRVASVFTRSNPLDNPAVPLSSPAAWGWLSGGAESESGELVNDQTTLAVSTCYACIRVLSESVAALPLTLYRRTPQGRIQATDHSLFHLLSAAPNEEMTAFTFFEVLVTSMALCGNAYAEIERNGAGEVIGLWPLHPRQTNPVRLDRGQLAYQTSDGMSGGQRRNIAAANMLHIPLFPSFDGVVGLSPLQLNRQTIGHARAVEKFGSRFFRNYATPAIAFLTDAIVKPEDKAKMRAGWEDLQSGGNQHRVAILDQGIKLEKLGLSPEDGQYLETRKFLREELASIYRVPVHMVGSTEKLSLSSTEQLQLSFVVDSLMPYLSRIQSEILKKLLPPLSGSAAPYVVEFDLSMRLRGDVTASTNYYKTGIQFGWLCPNDVRRELNLNEGPAALNVFQTPVNMMNSERLLDLKTPLSASQSKVGNDE